VPFLIVFRAPLLLFLADAFVVVFRALLLLLLFDLAVIYLIPRSGFHGVGIAKAAGRKF
jgi:hypothetical protein